MSKNHDSQDWNYLLHFGTFKQMLLEGKIEEDAIFDYIKIWKNQKCWQSLDNFLGIDNDHFSCIRFYPYHIKDILMIYDKNELYDKYPLHDTIEFIELHDLWICKRRSQYVCKKCGCHFKKANGEYVCWNCGSKKDDKNH